MSEPPDLPPRSCIRAADRGSLQKKLGEWEYQLLTLDGADVRDKATLMAAVAEQLPLPEGMAPKGWDGLRDALFEIFVRAGSRVALLWLHAEALVAGDLQDFLQAASVVENARVSALQRGAESVVAFFLGDGEGYRPAESVGT